VDKIYLIGGIILVSFLLGLGLGYKLYKPTTKIIVGNTKEIILRDTSIIIQRVTDTILQTKLVPVKNTKVLNDVSIKIVPDTILKIDTLVSGDTTYITKTLGCDTIEVRMAILKDNKTQTLTVQAKAVNGTIVGAIQVPKSDLIFGKEFTNSIGIYGNFSPQDGTTIMGINYDRGIGPFVFGGMIGTQAKKWDNINIGIKTGIRW